MEVLKDGYVLGIPGGVDSSLDADLIDASSAAFANNVSFRGGKPHTRPRFKQVALESFSFNNHFFQGGYVYYNQTTGSSVLVGATSGTTWLIDPLTGDRTPLIAKDSEYDTTHTYINDRSLRHYFCQADKYLIIQDGKNLPIIYDGVKAYRAAFDQPMLTTVPTTGVPNNNYRRQITSLTRVGDIATCSTGSIGHGFLPGDLIRIKNALPDVWDTEHVVESATATTFTFRINTTAATPATVGNEYFQGSPVGFAYAYRAPQIPIGTIMAYGQGRLFVVSPDRVEIKAGDLIGSYTELQEKSVLHFTEDTYLAEGGSLRMPASQGRINALSFIPYQDTATGQGPLFAFGEYGTSSFLVEAPRIQWSQIPLQQITLLKQGCVSHDSIVGFNSDLLYRDFIGIRSYRQSRGDLNTYGQTSISAEVERPLKYDARNRLGYISSVTHENRFLSTCTPQFPARTANIVRILPDGRILTDADPGAKNGDVLNITGCPVIPDGDYVIGQAAQGSFSITPPPSEVDVSTVGKIVNNNLADIYHKGMVVLDFLSTAGARNKNAPAWDGVWSGLNIQKLVTGIFGGRERCYAFCKDVSTNQNIIWEITNEDGDDEFTDGTTRPITAYLETKMFAFQEEARFTIKTLVQMNLWLAEIRGSVDVSVKYRADSSPCWQEWGPDIIRCSPVSDPLLTEANENVIDFLQNLPTGRERIDLGVPPVVCDDITKSYTRNGYMFQILLEWAGVLKWDKIIVQAKPKHEPARALCANGELL